MEPSEENVSTETRVDVEGTKYTWIVTAEGRIRCLRHGQSWIASEVFEVGAKALIALIHHAAQLRNDLGLALAVGREALSIVADEPGPDNPSREPREPTENEIEAIMRWRWPGEAQGVTYGKGSPQAANMREQALVAWRFFRGFP